MIYPSDTVTVPEYEGMKVRLLTADDMPLVKAFKDSGGCAECHLRAIQIHFDGKGNAGMKPIGVFESGKLISLAMPTLDQIRELRKYDIGAIFTFNSVRAEKAVDLIWKYAIYCCIKDKAYIGNAYADEDDPILGTYICERIGLVKIAKNYCYSK